MIRVKQNWLKSPLFDSAFILFPSFIAVFFVFFMKDSGLNSLPLWMWVAFVMCIDVSHVYSTLFKTYFHSPEFEARKNLYLMVPIVVLITGIVLYSLGKGVFWSVLAYLAVFHFIRQQYGFMRLYDRGADLRWKKLDNLTIYAATLYPIIYWHVYPREFHWFIDGDFFFHLPEFFEKIGFILWILIIGLYALKEIYLSLKSREINVAKNLIVLGTVVSWYTGIVWFNGDIAFTVTNVTAHGIPYMALIWIWGSKSEQKHLKKSYAPILFLGLILLMAYVEEGLWAGLVWREHLEVFKVFSSFPEVSDKATLSWIVPLLTLPQATHYILDGFIWKVNKDYTAFKP